MAKGEVRHLTEHKMRMIPGVYYVWCGGSCDYGHDERWSGGAYIIQKDDEIIARYINSDDHTTEFRMILSVIIHAMEVIPEDSKIVILTNAAYIQNFDKVPTPKSSNPDLITRCIELKQRHNSVSVKIVQYHKSPLLIETHNISTEAMKKLRQECHKRNIIKGKVKLLLCIFTIGIMFLTSCSGISNKVSFTTNQEQKLCI